MQFLFERLEVYQRAVSFLEKVEKLVETVRERVSFPFSDQLIRATLSIALNIAEGNGRNSPKDKKQFFYIARGSIFETIPILELFRRKGLVQHGNWEILYGDLQSLAMMLTKLIQSQNRLK